jgi:hypothetical protein
MPPTLSEVYILTCSKYVHILYDSAAARSSNPCTTVPLTNAPHTRQTCIAVFEFCYSPLEPAGRNLEVDETSPSQTCLTSTTGRKNKKKVPSDVITSIASTLCISDRDGLKAKKKCFNPANAGTQECPLRGSNLWNIRTTTSLVASWLNLHDTSRFSD